MSSSLNDIHQSKGCLVSKSASSGTILYVCDSGHAVCEDCHNKNTQQKQRKHSRRHSKKELKRSIPMINLACGDHEELTKKQNFIQSKKDGDFRTTVEYKNLIYSASNSNSGLISKINLEQRKDRSNLPLERKRIFPRPIECPHCRKMTSTTAFYQHFQFDHSKIPTVCLPFNSLQAIQFKVSNISTESRCITVFLTKRMSDNSVTGVDHIPLLLMAAILDTTQNTTIRPKCVCKGLPMLASNVCSQTDSEVNKRRESHERNKVPLTTEHSKSTSTVYSYQTDEVLIMWIVKIEDDDYIYNIAISNEDKTLGYSYTGKTIDIKDQQDTHTIYHRSECLIIHGKAIHRLICENCLLVSVTMIATNKNI